MRGNDDFDIEVFQASGASFWEVTIASREKEMR
jgi:hypothetical protein